MLQAIRKRQKLLLTVFITLISIVFVFWGFYGGGVANLTTKEVASVNGDRISVKEFQFQYQNTVRFYQNILKDKFTPEIAERFNLKRMTLNQLIDQKLIVQGAKSLGIQITDEEIRDQIVDTKYFKRNNQFDEQQYRAILKTNRLTPAIYEENVKLDLLQNKVSALLRNHLKVTSDEVLKDYVLKNEKTNIEFVRIARDSVNEGITVTDTEVAAFPESDENMTRARNFYTENEHLYKEEQQIQARHILIKFPDKATGDDKKAAKARITELKSQLKTQDFADIAKKHSDDKATAVNGGDLGFFAKGRMVKAFEDVAFSLSPGETSDIVESPFGYHIIKVEDVKPEKKQTFEDVKISIFKKLLLDDKSIKQAKLVTEQLWAQKIDKRKFKQLLKTYKLKWEETGLFARNSKYIPKIGQAPEIMGAAFKLGKKGSFANNYFKSKNRYFIVRLKATKSPDLKKFKSEEAALTNQFLTQKQTAAYTQWLKRLKDSAKISIRRDIIDADAS